MWWYHSNRVTWSWAHQETPLSRRKLVSLWNVSRSKNYDTYLSCFQRCLIVSALLLFASSVRKGKPFSQYLLILFLGKLVRKFLNLVLTLYVSRSLRLTSSIITYATRIALAHLLIENVLRILLSIDLSIDINTICNKISYDFFIII